MITLASQSGGVYDYDLAVPSGIEFNGTAIVLSGLSGVTNATLSGTLATTQCGVAIPVNLEVQSFTSSTVTVASNEGSSVCIMPLGTLGTLEVTSSITTAGTVNYELDPAFASTETGTVQGPVASAAPEPATLSMLAGALAALAFGRRRKFRAFSA